MVYRGRYFEFGEKFIKFAHQNHKFEFFNLEDDKSKWTKIKSKLNKLKNILEGMYIHQKCCNKEISNVNFNYKLIKKII